MGNGWWIVGIVFGGFIGIISMGGAMVWGFMGLGYYRRYFGDCTSQLFDRWCVSEVGTSLSQSGAFFSVLNTPLNRINTAFAKKNYSFLAQYSR